MTYFNLANINFAYSLCRGRNLAGEIPTRHFPVRNSKQLKTIILWKHGVIMIFDYTRCIWTAIIISVLPVEGNHTILFWGIFVSFSLLLPLSLQTKSSNWVLWGPVLPWALCCGCLIGSVIHKQTTVYCTVLVVEASEYCLSTFTREDCG